MPFTVVPATHRHAHLIVLRKSDEQEAAEWVPGLGPHMALSESIGHSTEAYSALVGDSVVAIYGFTVQDHEVHPWLMCSDQIGEHGRQFLRMARDHIQSLAKQYPGKLVGNYVFKENLQAKRLLSFLGFRWIHSPGLTKFDFFYHPQSCALTQ